MTGALVRHVVLVRFREDADPGEVAAVFRELAGIIDRVEGMLDFQAGPNVSPEGLNRGYGHAFTVDFADAAARDRYLADEAHARVGARLAFDLLLS